MKGERVAQLELLLRSHPEGIRRAEIARRLGVHRSTISRYVAALSDRMEIYEENNLIKLRDKDEEFSPMELSVYESLAFNMGAEALASSAEFANPHLASGLRKLAMNMRSYAPRISDNALFLADKIEKEVQKNKSLSGHYNEILEVLIDCWVSGHLARLSTTLPDNEEIEIAPYFIGYKDEGDGRKPITVKDIITFDIASITDARMLDETYTIPDNLKPFLHTEEKKYDAIDMIPLKLWLSEKSALNSFYEIIHDTPVLEKAQDGSWICRMKAENSIELMLRIIQSGTSVRILEPESFRKKLVSLLDSILRMYR